MTDFGGLSVKELPQSLKDALLDPTLQRAAPASGTNVLATLADAVGGGGGGGGGAALKKEEAQDTSGPHVNATTVYALVPNTLISFTLDEPKDVYFSGFATAFEPAVGCNVQLGLRVDGIDHDGSSCFGAGNEERTVVVAKALNLGLGAHTAQLVFRQGTGGGSSARIQSSAGKPTRLVSLRTIPVFGVGAISKAEAEKTDAEFTTASTSFVVVPGISVTFTLPVQQAVFLKATGTARVDDTAVAESAQIGIRVNGVDYPGTLYRASGTGGGGIDLFGALEAHVAVTLPAGTYTAEVLLRGTSGETARLAVTTNRVLRLTALFTNPQAFPASLGFVKETAEVVVDFGGSGLVPGTLLSFTLTTAQKVLVHAQTAGIFANVLAGQATLFLRHTDPALVVTDRKIGETFESDGGDFVAGSSQGVCTFVLSLAAGTHTFQLFAGGNTSIFAPMQVHAIAQEPI